MMLFHNLGVRSCNHATGPLSRIIFTLFFALTALTIVSSPAAAGEFRLTTDAAYQGRPAIYGDKVVYADSRRARGDIFSYDLSTSLESRVTTDGAEPDDPAVYGDRVVWQDARGGDWDIYSFSWATGNTKRITADGSDQTEPALYADKIVWVDRRNGRGDIYLYNLTTSSQRRITTDASTQTAPAIHGDKIVWEDYRNGPDNPDIYMYDLTAETEQQLTTDTAKQIAPDIYGNKIVWEDYRNGADNPDIYLLDLAGGGERRITDDPKKQRAPAIQGNRIVWEDTRIYHFDVWLYDLTTGRDYRMSTHTSSERYPRIYGDNIVYQARRRRNNDVFLFEITPPRTSMTTDLGAPNGIHGWYTTRPRITLTADEPAALYYQWDSSLAGGWQAYGGPLSPPEGKHILYFYGDCAGAAEAVKGRKLMVDTRGPAAAVRSPRTVTKARVGSGFEFSWSHTDPQPLSRFVSYDVQYKRGNRRWAPWLANTKAESSNFIGSLGESYSFRARARDRAGNFGAWSEPSKTTVPFDQDSHIKRRRGFERTATTKGARFFNGTLRYSKDRRDRVIYAFSGRRFTLFTTLGPDRGQAKIYVDGRYWGTVDAYAATVKYRRPIATLSWSQGGRHTVKIVNKGVRGRRRFDLDAHAVEKGN